MNKISKILSILFIVTGIIFLNGCVKDTFDAPAEENPTVDFSANMTIAQLNQYYLDSMPSGLGKINSDIIIQGIVVGNDQTGNIYKTLYLQDATAGIQIAIDQSDMYTKYRLGQRLFIKCKDLYLGNYGGVTQIGYLYGTSIGRIPSALVSLHLFNDSLPGPAPTPTVVNLPLTSAEISTLVRIDNVIFASDAVGQPFSLPTGTTDRIFSDLNGNKIALRTSNYATFAGKLVPGNMGSIVGIYSVYNGSPQFYIRDTTDLINFTQISPIFLDESFSTDMGVFTAYSVTGAEVWEITSYGATITGWNGTSNNANEDWLISSSLNLDNYTDEILTFETTMNYGTAGDGSLKLFYSTNYTSGAPSTGSWTEITGFTLSAGGWVTTSTGNINLSAIIGSNVHIALKYVSTTSNSATWEITNMLGMGTPN